MKNFFAFFSVLFVLTSCGNGKEDPVVVANSSGNINNLSVIMENDLWTGEVGEAVRRHLAAPVDGLPQEEPLFSLSQMPPEAYQGFARKNRIFLHIQKGQEPAIKMADNAYARPQKGIFITGENNEQIISLIEENAEKIISTFKRTELTEQQRRIKKSLKSDEKLEEQLGVSLKFPTAYRYAKETDDFFWIRKDIPTGSMEILVYEVPRHVIEKDTNIVGNIIEMRDSIGQTHIPGRVDGSYMVTESAYAPYLFESQIDGKFAWESKGIWEVRGDFMGGPFINYAVLDEENDRYVVLEGFAFSPSARKRENMMELEAILKSAEIK
ncbi:DUF4837 family protein [Salinimicrobium tongyeongense]|jgi:hypothetical protein|uniref:DUF4837 family protein n=1 Tax=Salinimicrobium tongyeongense TaxID=2809707 RepID=A0ABY6NUZ9_9FLAO|nr:DUF4837 family protein [Salinimicrobium tongyeongense]UZH56633.1 DUF4837 family protein [Salinimicrobium tongyeongense]